MKYKLKDEKIKTTEELLNSRGVLDIEGYLEASSENLSDWRNLKNIESGANLIKTIKEGDTIGIIVDCDTDGHCAAAIIVQYLKELYMDIKFDLFIHKGKEHGLGDVFGKVEESEARLIIIPDAGSNDIELFKLLEKKKAFLILDHHDFEGDCSLQGKNYIIINNQTSPNYKNKALCGAGVVFQFCRALDFYFDRNFAFDYIDLAALATVGDMMDVREMENRFIIKEGFSNIKNLFFQVLCEKQSYSMKGKVNPITVAFYVVPLINAMIRVGEEEEKERLVRAFLDGNYLVPCNKRGAKGTMERVAVESARECTNARTKQNKIKDTATEILSKRIEEKGLLENKVLFVRLEEEDNLPSTLTGLVAMQLSAKYKKPTIVARRVKENNENKEKSFLRGSARGLNDSELKDFKGFLQETELFEYAQGHANAFGLSIEADALSEFHEIANELLREVDFNSNYYEVDFEFSADESKQLAKIVEDIDKYDGIWGQQNPEPIIAVKNIYLSQSDYEVIGQYSNTLKFKVEKTTFIKFFAKDLIEKFFQAGDMKITLIGKANMNFYGGEYFPQVFIEDCMIEEDDGIW